MYSVTTEVHGCVRCGATDEDDSLSRSMMTFTDQWCDLRDRVYAFASGHWRSLAFERSPISISNFYLSVVILGMRSSWTLSC